MFAELTHRSADEYLRDNPIADLPNARVLNSLSAEQREEKFEEVLWRLGQLSKELKERREAEHRLMVLTGAKSVNHAAEVMVLLQSGPPPSSSPQPSTSAQAQLGPTSSPSRVSADPVSPGAGAAASADSVVATLRAENKKLLREIGKNQQTIAMQKELFSRSPGTNQAVKGGSN